MNANTTGSDYLSSRGPLAALRAIGFATLATLLCVLPVSAATVSYQQDVGGYTGTEDTFLQSDPANAGTDNGAAAFLGWDDDDPSQTGQDVYSLIRFANIFGGGAGQIPLGSEITSATLYMTVFNVGDTGEVRNALVPWSESDTFNSFCAGSCDEGVEHGPLVSTAPAATAVEIGVNVTTSMQAWSDGTTNNGWFIRPIDGGNDGVDVQSSEFATISARPRLVVVYDEGPPVVGNLIREPYLSLATPTSQTICWRSDVSSDSRVQYGLSSGGLTNEATDAAVVTDHCVNVDNLTPATQYWYNVGSATAVQGGGTVEHYFWTHPVVGSVTPFTFWAVGDGGNGTPDQITVMDAMLTEAGAGGPDLGVYLGDIAYNSGTDSEFTNNYFTPYSPVIRNTVVWPALGNHEGASTTSGDPGPSTGPYYEAFVLPQSAEAGGLASGTEAYYSFDYGNVHFIALNSYNVNRASTGTMATWLNFDLLSTSQQWIVAYWHHPPYTRGTHNSDFEIELIEMREEILPILEAGGVDLVLTGHSHTYERSYLIDGAYTTPTPNFATLESQGNIVDDGDGRMTGDGPYLKSPGGNANEGAVYVVAGHGGQPVGGSHGHPVMYFAENVKGSCLIDVDANTLNLRNVRITGVVSDTFTIQKGDLPPRVTATDPPKQSVIGALTSIEVTFSTGVTGVDALDLTVNGSAATSVVPNGTDVYTFSGFAAPGDGTVTVVLAAGGIVDESNPGLVFTGDVWSYRIDTSPPAIADETPARGTSIGVLPSVTVDFTKPVFNVSAADLLVNGSPATVLSGIDGTSGPYIFSGFTEPDQGLVTVELLQNGIQDDQALLFAGDTWNYVLETRLVINEFLASNNTIIADEIGGFDDYLEIHNPGNSTIDMSGMYLTNQLQDPTRYEIPAGVTIGPGEYLLFWCNPATADLGPLHTNFNLDKDAVTNEDIGLFDTAANGFAIIDGLTYTLQVSDISSGRFPDATNGIVTMPPTPEATNTISCSVPADCSALTGACTVGNCVGSVCVAEPANEGGACDDGISCTSGETCSTGDCQGGTSNCPVGETCNVATDVCEVGSSVATFQQGASGYTGTVDTYLQSAATTADNSTASPLIVDLGPEQHILLRFENLFVSAGGPIPDGATIDSATLTINVTNESAGVGASLHRMLQTWADTDNWGSWTGGIQADDAEAVATADVSSSSSVGLHDIDVTTSLAAWSAGAANHGWAWLPPATDNSWQFDSSEGAVRPLLTVNYTVSIVCTIDADCDDLQFCNGTETCDVPSGNCVAGTPPVCVDAVTCTVDACNEITDSCDNIPSDAICDDGNVCTDNTCDLLLGCQSADNTDPCEDGDLCTENDVCAGGTCQTGSAVDCNDSVSCTTDSCDSGLGCQNVDNCPVGEVCNLVLDICETPPPVPLLPIEIGDDWRYLKGTEEPTPADLTAWTEIGFDDTSWPEGPSGIGYDYYAETGGTNGNGDYEPFIGTQLPDMRNCTPIAPPLCNDPGYFSVYMRKAFTVTNPAAVTSLTFNMYADDGYVAYLNGTEVARIRVTGTPPLYNTPVTGGPSGTPPIEETIDLTGDIGLLVAGTNVLAIQGHNANLSSRDLLMLPQLSSTESVICLDDNDCDDLQFCNGVETCDVPSGNCIAGTPPDCTDAVVCTIDTCNETTDSCNNTPDDGACDDTNICTDDSCDMVSGCQFTNNTAPCEDGDLCTGPDLCAGGGCATGPPVICDDFVSCTNDSCNSGTGCQNVDNCPVGESCNLGLDICEGVPSAPPLPIVQGDTWTYFKGTVEPTTPIGDLGWAQVGFDDSSWLSGPSGFGYGDISAPHTLLTDMQNGYASVYFRHEFSITNPAQVESLIFTVDYDDALVAYINGVEVVRTAGLLAAGDGTPQGVPPTFDQIADFPANTSPGGDQNHEASSGTSGNPPEAFDIGLGTTTPAPPAGVTTGTFVVYSGTLSGLLQAGNNVIAIHGHNRSLPSSDFVIIPTMTATFDAGCVIDGDCDDGEDCTDDTCNTGTGECVFTPNDLNACDDGEVCTDDVCSAGICVSTPDDGNVCTDAIACTDDACATGVCVSVDNCTGGDVCNVSTGICETPLALQAGDVIVSGFQPIGGTEEWVELFNTTTSAIALDNLELIVRLDANPTPDGVTDIDWQLPAGLLTGATIAPQGFFLLRESAGPPAGDLTGALDLATGEGGDRAISVELIIDGVHMDYLLYGRNDVQPVAAADVPPGDLAFDGVTFPRTEVIRSCAPLSAGQCDASPPNFTEGAVLRLTDTALYAGYDVEGYYADETALSSGFPDGVWTSDHAAAPVTDPRNSGSPTVPPPTGTPCLFDTDCDDNDVCNGIETCNLGTGFCQSGTPLVCDDGNVCTDDSCDSIAGCQTANNTDPCNDLNACTNADVCGAGVCLGVPISCDDGVSCTDDSCDTVLGCQNLDNCPVGQTCNLGTDICEAGPVIVTFQNDGTYTGTQDAFLMESEPALTHGTLTDTCPGTAPGPCDNFEWDADDPSTTNQQNIGLLRFDGIVGPGVDQVPQGTSISSATLTVTLYDPSTTPPADIYISLADWDQTTATWDNFGGEAGVQPDELGADVGDAPIANGTAVIDITTAVQGWVDDPASNFGLIFLPNHTNGAVVRASEYAADPNLRPMLTVEYIDVGAVAEMTCSLSSATAPPNGSVDLDVFLASPSGDVDVRGFQTQIQIALTSGSGSLSVPCPGGVFVDEVRSDYIFFNETNDSSVTTCALMRASASMLSGSTTVGATPVYLSEYTLEVAAGTTAGTTFEVSFAPTPGSRLADENAGELPLALGPVCTLTVEGCSLDSDCDDGSLCTTDTCNAGTCENTPVDCSASGDQCNDGVCNPGTGLCEQQPANEGLGCDDLDACTVGDVCTGGVCGGPALDCSDGSVCTNETCSAGLCIYSPSGVCGIEGDVFYYRDNTADGFEPSTKAVPNVEIDINQDVVADATSTSGGYVVASAGSPVLVEAMDKLGTTTISDDNGAITSFDATFIAQHAVSMGTPLSTNQLVAGDVSGNGTVSSFDAAQVAQFAVDLLPGDHFQVAFDRSSDWAFFRCDNYVDASNQDCGPPSYLHDPLLATALDDDFHAVLYGDVTGNWEPLGRSLAGSADRVNPEETARGRDRALADQLRDGKWAERLAMLQQIPSGVLLPGAELEIIPTTAEVVNGVKRQTYLVEMRRGDGIQGLDLEMIHEPNQVRVIDVRTGEAAADFNLLSNGLRGTHKIALYGVLPLQGTGTVVELTVEIASGAGTGEPFKISALANERPIPVRMKGTKEALAPEPAKRHVRQVN